MSATDPDPRTRTALYLAVLMMFGLAITSIFFGRYESHADARPEGLTPELRRGERRAAEPAAKVLVGRVFLERERDHDAPAVEDTGGGSPGAEPEGADSMEAATRPGAEEAARGVPMDSATACAVSVWRTGRMLIEGSCDREGRFSLALPPGALSGAEVTSVELLVPRYLRASLPLTGSEAAPQTVTGATVDLGAIGLGPAVPLRGLVIDASGSGVADVVVEAMPVDNLGEPEPWRATTDAEGQFEYRTLPRGPLRVALADPRYAPSVVEAVAPDHEVVLPVSRYKTVAGTVHYDTAIEAAGLPVLARIQGSGVWPPRTAKVDSDGTFVFDAVPDGVYAVEALALSADGSDSFASDIVEDVSPDDPVSLTLKPSGWVRVQVLGPGGQPVAAARVTAGFGALSMLQKVGTTDGGGFATVGPLGVGSQVVSVAADGFLPAPGLMVEVATDSDRTPVQVRLTRPQTLRGRVVDPRGGPSPSAVVELVATSAFTPGENQAAARVFSTLVRTATGSLGVTTGPVPGIPLFAGAADVAGGRVPVSETGEFEFNGLVPGEYTLVAYDAGYARSAPVVVRLPRASSEAVVLTLREGVLVDGRVSDHRGVPLEDAIVQVVDDGVEVQTDTRGRFDVGTRTGTVILLVRAEGYAPRRVSRSLEESSLFLEVQLTPATGRFSGRARGGNDRVVEGAIVRLTYADPLFRDHVMVSDGRGLLEADGLVTGPAKLEIMHPDHVSQTRSIVVGEGEELSEIVLVSGWELVVEVRDRKTGDRVANARAMADARGVRSNRRGEARFSHLPAGTILLEVLADGYVPWRETLTGEHEGQVDQVVELEEGGSIEGEVRDDVGEVVPNIRVEVARRRGGEVLGEATTDAGGRFRVDALPEGEVEVFARVPAARREFLGDARLASDVLPGQVTRDVFLRFDRRAPQN